MRSALAISLVALLCGCTSADPELWKLPPGMSWGQPEIGGGELRVEIQSPARELELGDWETSLQVKGAASVFGGVRYLDLMLALDTSRSLASMDPDNYRSAGAVRLVRSLPDRSDIRVGVVDFDSKAKLVLPLTADRDAAVKALEGLDRDGQTDIAAGLMTALEELERTARPDSTRVVMLFTDGRSNARNAHAAMQEARKRGVVVHTLLLGTSEGGETILRGMAAGTGGSFVGMTDPEKLAEAFVNLRTTGVERVDLSVNGSQPIATRLIGGTFSGRVSLRPGENRIVATATSLAGETREAAVHVTVSRDMRMSIESPAEGTVLGRRKAEIVIEGEVDPYVGLPAAFELDRERLGTRSVMLEVDGSPARMATVMNGRFRGMVVLQEGENRVTALATSVDGRTAMDSVTVTLRPDGCAELQVMARADGQPALSISDRAVEIVFDASGSMWGQMEGRSKISVAKEILSDALDSLPDDLELGLRVYGHRQPRELHDCTDSELMVPLAAQNRHEVRRAIASFKPRGQTPLAYSLRQVAHDFGDFAGERAVVLVTDGIESCGGDPVRAARELARLDTMVHVIGFGLRSEADEDAASLAAIADASGGRFLSARSAEELREALAVTVGTPYEVLRGGEIVGEGALGSDEPILLPAGQYRLRLDSKPPRDVAIVLVAEEGLAVGFEREGGVLTDRAPVDYTRCEDIVAAPEPAIPEELEESLPAKRAAVTTAEPPTDF